MAHHCSAGGNSVPRARIPDESFSCDSSRRCAIQQRHLQPDIKVSFIYLHDTGNGQHQIVNEGQSGWVLQAVMSRASFRRLPRDGTSFFTVMSLHIKNNFSRKRGIGKKLQLTVRTVLLTWLRATSTALHGTANLAVTLDPLALFSKRSPIRA